MTNNIAVNSNFDRLRLIMCKLLSQTHSAELLGRSIRLYSLFSETTKLEENLCDFDPTGNYWNIEFTYLLGQKPGFKHQFLAADEIDAKKIID